MSTSKDIQRLADAFHALNFNYLRKYRFNNSPWLEGERELLVEIIIAFARFKRTEATEDVYDACSMPLKLEEFMLPFHLDYWLALVKRWAEYQLELAKVELHEISVWVVSNMATEEAAEYLSSTDYSKLIIRIYILLDDICLVMKETMDQDISIEVHRILESNKTLFEPVRDKLIVLRDKYVIPDNTSYSYWELYVR
jgi:hypothetical protein